MKSAKHDEAIICPSCGSKNDGTTSVGCEVALPKPGDFLVCFSCAAAMRVTEKGYPHVRLMTEGEQAALDPRERALFARTMAALKAKVDMDSVMVSTNEPEVAAQMAGQGAVIVGVGRPSRAPRKWRPLQEVRCARCGCRVFVSKIAPSWSKFSCVPCGALLVEMAAEDRRAGGRPAIKS